MKRLESSVKAPDRNAQFEELYAQYADDVLRMAYFYLADKQKAEDVCQDVFVKLYTRGEAIAPGCEKAWLLRVTVNCCRDLWRSAWLKRVVLGAPTLEIIPAQEDTIEQREEKAELMRAIHKLPVQFRETILLQLLSGPRHSRNCADAGASGRDDFQPPFQSEKKTGKPFEGGSNR